MKENDKVRANGRYADIKRRFGDSVQEVKAIGNLPGNPRPLVWLKCGGGCFCADGFDVVEGEVAE